MQVSCVVWHGGVSLANVHNWLNLVWSVGFKMGLEMGLSINFVRLNKHFLYSKNLALFLGVTFLSFSFILFLGKFCKSNYQRWSSITIIIRNNNNEKYVAFAWQRKINFISFSFVLYIRVNIIQLRNFSCLSCKFILHMFCVSYTVEA